MGLFVGGGATELVAEHAFDCVFDGGHGAVMEVWGGLGDVAQ